MTKRLLEEACFSPANPPSKFSKGCILLANSPIKLPELVAHLSSNLEDLMTRGKHSKIFILNGTQGNEEGTDVPWYWYFRGLRGLMQGLATNKPWDEYLALKYAVTKADFERILQLEPDNKAAKNRVT